MNLKVSISDFKFPISNFLFFASLSVLIGCSSPKIAKPVDAEINVISSAAMKAFARGQVEQAARQYARALDRAHIADSASDICDQAYNLAACLLILGQPNQAQTLLREAQAEAHRLGRPEGDILLLEAKAARAAGQGEAALRHVETILTAQPPCKSSERLQALLIRALVHCDSGKANAAELAEIRMLALEVNDPSIQAEVAQLAGRSALLEKEFARADAAFDREASLLQKAGRFREMAQALVRAGNAYSRASQSPEAADRLHRAARCLFAQGDAVGALRQIEPALDAAKSAKQDELLAQIVALFDDIKQTVGQPAKRNTEKN